MVEAISARIKIDEVGQNSKIDNSPEISIPSVIPFMSVIILAPNLIDATPPPFTLIIKPTLSGLSDATLSGAGLST